MLNQPVALADLDGVILDFGGVLYDIDYNAPPKAFARLGDADFASLYHQASQSSWFDDLEMGQMARDTFYTHLLNRCAKGTTMDEVLEAWCCILTGMPASRAELVVSLGRQTRLFLLSNTNAIHAAVFEEDLRKNLPIAAEFWQSFEVAHYSHDLGRKKPHPDTFLHVWLTVWHRSAHCFWTTASNMFKAHTKPDCTRITWTWRRKILQAG